MSVADVAAFADGTARPVLDPYALERVERSWHAAVRLAENAVRAQHRRRREASFASQGARLLTQAVVAYRQVLACELVTAVRALRQHAFVPGADHPVGKAYATAAEVLDPDMADRPLAGDVAVAAVLLDALGSL
jgi:hypothetical protein